MLSLFKSRCGICKRKVSEFQRYRLPNNKVGKVCLACCVYAERRAYRKC